MNIRSVQMNIVSDKETNINHAFSIAAQESLKNTDVVLFPEMFTTGYQLDNIKSLAHARFDETFTRFSNFAKDNNVNVLLGSIALRDGDKVTNTTFVFNRHGEIISEYSKTHLFGLMNEPFYMNPGMSTHTFLFDNEPMTSIICYDLRFPEITRALATKHKPKVIFVPMEWPAPRTEAFRTLLKARAIENQCFVVSCNRVGEENGSNFEGSSMIIDPYGTVISELKNEEGCVNGTIDLSLVDKIRSHMTCFEDRREEIYRNI